MARVLVVEDNPSNRELLGFILRSHGFEVAEAANGMEGLEMARTSRPDIVVMDIQMPVMDGMKALKRLRDDPATRDLKVVAVTSFAMKGDREKALEAGFDAYVSKPIDTRAFPVILRDLLGGEGGQG